MDGFANLRLKLNQLAALFVRHWETLRFVLTIVLPPIVRSRRRPVIFSRYSGMGDIICTIPAARELMKRHPGAAFIYNCHPDFAAIPRLAGVSSRITSLKGIGLVGYWYRFLLGGFYHFAHGDDQPNGGCREPMVAEFCRQFGLPVVEDHPMLPVTQEAHERAARLLIERGLDLTSLVLIHPGPSWPVREWPHEKWVELVEKLRQHGFSSIARLGVGRYLNFGRVEVPVISGAVSLLDAFSVDECIAAISLAKLFIGIDSGLLHVAAAVRTPAVGIFGMSLPEFRFSKSFRQDFVVAHVECVGCEHRKPPLHWITGCPYNIRCMQTLGVGEVMNACLAKVAAPETQFSNAPPNAHPL